MVERDRERRQKEFDKKVKSNSDLFNEDTESESENVEPRKKYKARKTLDSSDSEGMKHHHSQTVLHIFKTIKRNESELDLLMVESPFPNQKDENRSPLQRNFKCT